MEKYMVRAIKVSSEDLDVNLTLLQEDGNSINQIIPCPEAMKFECGENDAFGGAVEMNFMIIYSEKENN
jgi:hypothetical protein